MTKPDYLTGLRRHGIHIGQVIMAGLLSLQALAAEAPSADFWEFYENFADEDGQVIEPEDTLLQSSDFTERLQELETDKTLDSTTSPETTP